MATSSFTSHSCSADEYARQTLTVDFLFLDRERCERCAETERNLETALERIDPILSDLGMEVILRRVHVQTPEDARRTRLEISPTVRIDGRAVQPAGPATTCESCSACADGEGDIDCREWLYRGEAHAAAPVELLVEAVLEGAFTPSWVDGPLAQETYTLPENLASFFGEDEGASECGCECGCG
ncbi:MAG: DUF2703 domain-containing protein [Halodesulfurarchaeum sp.]